MADDSRGDGDDLDEDINIKEVPVNSRQCPGATNATNATATGSGTSLHTRHGGTTRLPRLENET